MASKQCEGKVRHTSLGAAWKHAESLRTRNLKREYLSTRPYKCEFCGGFHIGHRMKRMRQAEVRRKYER